MSFPQISNAQIVDAVKLSFSIRQVLLRLDLHAAGDNYTKIRSRITGLGLDMSHFRPQVWNRGKKLDPRSAHKDILLFLEHGVPIQSTKLKKRLISSGVFKHECMNCHNTTWLGKPTPLDLHHIDGNNKNNKIDNLQVLCPNCHSLTNNFRGKAKRKITVKAPKVRPLKKKTVRMFVCPVCEQTFNEEASCRSIYCSQVCAHAAQRKASWPSSEELHELVWSMATSKVAKRFGVSDKAVEKWCRNMEIEKPPRGYWAKVKAGKIPEGEK